MPPRVRRRSVKGTIAGFIGGLLFALVLTKADRNPPDAPGADYGVLFLILAMTLAVAVHEVGHLLAGWIVGFRFSFIQVGPVSLRKKYGRLKIQVRREMTALGYAGMHIDRVSRLRRRLLIYVAAGPAANLLSVPATVILMNYVFPFLGDTWVATPAAQFALISLLFAMISSIPFSPTLMSDGSRIKMLLSSKVQARRWISIVSLGAMANDGVHPRRWKQTWLAAATSLQDMTLDEFHGNWLAYASANDKKDAPLAAHRLERCLEIAHRLMPSLRDALAQEAAVFCAWFRDNLSLSEKWLAEVKKPKSISKSMRARINTALRCAKRDFGGALICWQEGRAFIEEQMPGPKRESLLDSWLEWKVEIQEHQAAEGTPTQIKAASISLAADS